MRHRNWLLLCGLILLGGTRCAESRSDDELKPVPDPISDKLIEIRLPYEPVLVQPDEVQPAPSPIDVSPQPVDTLAADQWYVIESSVPLIVLSSPDGFVGIDPSEGPIRVRGKFADGTGKVETRTFSQPHVYFVNAKQAGKIELIVIPQGVTAEDDIIRQPITVMGLAPIPPPGPGPEPPEPTVKNVRISVITDTDNVSAEAAAVLNGLVAWNGLFDAGNDYRMYDIQTDEPDGKKAIEQLNGPVPGIVITDKASGKVVQHGPLPSTFDELKQIVKGLTGG